MADESIPPVAVGESAGASTAAPPEPAAPEATAVPAPVAALVAATADSATGTPGPGTGTTTPLLSPKEIEKSLKVSLADMTAKATAMYVHKNYEEATELFSKAAEMQAEISGDMNPANAEILFLYGRALLKVGQSKSDVFGGKAPEAAKKGKPAPKKANGDKAEAKSAAEPSSSVAVEAAKTEEPTPAERITEEGVAILAAEAGGAKKEASAEPKKPLFQFEGDGDIDDSDEEEDEQDPADEDGQGEEELDDLGNAYEILDMARVLFDKQLAAVNEEASEDKGKGKEEGDAPSVRHIKERLADTHDLLAEISLEGERFHDAIPDSRKSLEFKKQLYPEESDILAEAHFKLSLALEFASIVATDEEKTQGVQHVDQALRDEAATELEAAIASTKLKLQNKEVELATNHSPEDNDVTRAQIADIKEVIADMEQRLVDLRNAPMDVDAILGKDNPLGGILGAALGESAAQVEARIEAAKKTATDLTGLVRKKAVPKEAEAEAEAESGGKAAETNGSNKRKLEEDDEPADEAKKVRTE
ncbi:histone H1-binding protein [Pyricularia oryzae 70-15]|uniref:Histone H1-binding protein n=3 Tax=Pyricularia oryzae TaxID=318829 RepID=G4N2R8_PYRO7|nr:histone H1-binding protein [Pyricularia oryzae 70-15]EHA52573.1 histone H1-binding protein [Pyricularia oryzae 70-15]ELQ34787.1 histone H1-binding protein [Pyricularia oryzae Y34]KAI7930360.1 histone H1-binding protein [Pyricularia oryzae]KAI7932035.1 histone H1-binding protein [Pyricularia oryzae]